MRRCAWGLMLFAGLAFSRAEPPHLIVQIVVDQLRADLLRQYANKFSPRGFNYLLNHGIDYQNASHPHANTTTCAGHTAVATGSNPAYHGIVANEWYDRKLGRTTNCVEDPQSPILVTPHTRIPLEGRSPAHILTSTLSDELVMAKRGRAFGVSFKDRSAIALAGHAGKAFWFDRDNGGMITSAHYYNTYPQWVSTWNAGFQPVAHTWTLSAPKTSYLYASEPPTAPLVPELGTGFPHQTGAPDSPGFYKRLATTPVADTLTASMATALVVSERLGKTPGQTDYLGISFSATDAIGHQFGPNSLESEDNLLQLDNTMAAFLATLDREVGLQNTLIILTADHGVSNAPAYLNHMGMPVHKPIHPEQIGDIVKQALQSRFDLEPSVLQAISLPYVYLDHAAITAKKLRPDVVRHMLATILTEQADIFRAFALPVTGETGWLADKVARMAFPDRSGDLYIVANPQQLPDGDSPDTHGTPWRYDSSVPLLMAHPKLPVRHIHRPVSTTDIAPTLSAILGILAPSGSVGKPLQEVTDIF